MTAEVTAHAAKRWAERFSALDIQAEYHRAKRVGKKRKRKIRERNRAAYEQWHTGIFKGRVLRVTPEGIVFVVAMMPDRPDVIITVYPLAGSPFDEA